MKRILQMATAVSIALLPTTALSQTVDYQAVIAEGVGTVLHFDQALETEHNLRFPLHFDLAVPLSASKDTLELRVIPGDDGNYAKLIYWVEAESIAQQILIGNAPMPSGSYEERSQALMEAMAREPHAFYASRPELTLHGIRPLSLGDYQGVEGVFTYRDPDAGLVILWEVIVLPPAGGQSLIFIVETAEEVTPIASLDDITETFAGVIIDRLRFTAWRRADGFLTPF